MTPYYAKFYARELSRDGGEGVLPLETTAA